MDLQTGESTETKQSWLKKMKEEWLRIEWEKLRQEQKEKEIRDKAFLEA